MKKVKKPIALALSVWLFCFNGPPILNVSPARADDSDIFGAEIQPNVLLAFDTSGSMDNTIYSDPYDVATTYTGTYATTKVYQRVNSAYTVYANTIADVTSSSARTALSSAGYWSGRIGGSNRSLDRKSTRLNSSHLA